MSLFKKGISISSIAKGKSLAIEEVPDEVFATKMMGDGYAVMPEENIIYAPTDGKVTMVMANTKHAVGLEIKDGIEIMIHVGLDSVNLEGQGFEAYVKQGDIVKKGDKLISFDLETLEKNNISPITMLVVVNDQNKKIKKMNLDTNVDINTTILELR
ncbi:MAG: PTS glucose transporter subunit IIA [Thomasclavelia sp.]|nr:PTS glucose transporter subunit IIA [Thomasclavelia sp.]